MIDRAHVISADKYVLAGFVVGRPWRPPLDDHLLPGAVLTVSDCLCDFLPPDQDPLTAPWHADLPSATVAARQPNSDAVHILAAHVPTADRDAVLTLLQRWVPYPAHPVPRNLTVMTAPAGEPRGFEVIGLEAGRFHSWLCYGLHQQAAAELGVAPARLGLLAHLDDARAVAAMANDNRDNPNGTPLDVTWFSVLIAEC